MSVRPLRLGSGRSPMAVYAGLAKIGHTDLVSEIFEPDAMSGRERLRLEGVVLGMPPVTLLPGVLDAGAVSGTMVIRERGEADAAEAAGLGREVAAQTLALGAAGLMRDEKDHRNDAHD